MEDVVADELVPLVAAGIGEFEATGDLLETDAVTTLVSRRLWEVGGADETVDGVVVDVDVDIDEARESGTDAMLEGILDEGDDNQRRNGGLDVGGDVGIFCDCLMSSMAESRVIYCFFSEILFSMA